MLTGQGPSGVKLQPRWFQKARAPRPRLLHGPGCSFRPAHSCRAVPRPALAATLVSDGVSTQKPALIADHAAAADARLAPPPITKSDERFLEDGMEFVWGAEGVNLAELNDLFQRVSTVLLLWGVSGWGGGADVFWRTAWSLCGSRRGST